MIRKGQKKRAENIFEPLYKSMNMNLSDCVSSPHVLFYKGTVELGEAARTATDVVVFLYKEQEG